MLHGIELPLHQNLIYWLSPTAALEQWLRAIWDSASQAAIFIWPQIKLNSQLSSCPSFFSQHVQCPGWRYIPLALWFTDNPGMRVELRLTTPILCPPDTKKTYTLRKDPDAGEDWRQEEKGTTENEMVVLQEGGPLPRPETGLLSNTQKWIVWGDTCADKARDFIAKGHRGGEQQGKETQENSSATWLAVLGFMVMGLVSGLSLANHLTQSPSWWCTPCSAKMYAREKDSGRWSDMCNLLLTFSELFWLVEAY